MVGEACLAVLSILDAVLLYTMATTDSIWTAYVGYLLFRALYQVRVKSLQPSSVFSSTCLLLR